MYKRLDRVIWPIFVGQQFKDDALNVKYPVKGWDFFKYLEIYFDLCAV